MYFASQGVERLKDEVFGGNGNGEAVKYTDAFDGRDSYFHKFSHRLSVDMSSGDHKSCFC